jgi:hypothetical protein
MAFFFLIFSIFLFFAIRPNILMAINLQNELRELQFKDEQYERTILNIVNYQTILEETRNDFYLLDEAVPKNPQLYAMIEQVQKAASDSGVTIQSLAVSEVQFKVGDDASTVDDTANSRGSKNAVQELSIEDVNGFKVKCSIEGTLIQSRNFLATLYNQRRLKVVGIMNLSAPLTATGASGRYSIAVDMQGFYL